MWLTRTFLTRPTLVLVLIAIVSLAGLMSLRSLVVQQFPNIENPVVRIGVSYSGASTTEMRDSIITPIENQLAGTPNLETLDTTIQNGQASISSTFSLDSDPNTDLVYVQRAVQAAQRQLPSDLVPPVANIGDPAEVVVATIGVSSKTMTPSALSLLVNGVLVPQIEQVDGISSVSASGTVQPSYQVTIEPDALEAAGLTVTDVTNSIQGNNVRAPGGIVYGPERETTLDIRGDITSPGSIGDLLIQAAPGSSGVSAAAATTNGDVNAWTNVAAQRRVSDVAKVVTGNEPQRTFAAVNGQQSLFVQVQKTATASEVTAAHNVLAALPSLRQRFPQLAFNVINVQATYTEQQLDGVLKTLAEGILFIAIVMLFFLHSWRNAIVVLIAIPTSLGVALFGMKLLGYTIDTISLLAMTLVIGILIDDSTVVLENIERHHELGQEPEEAALTGRTEIGNAAMVLTLVDVVVFLPIAFLQGQVGRELSEFGVVVTMATLASLLVSFTITPALAGLWSLHSDWHAPRWIVAFDDAFSRLRDVYHDRILPAALRTPWPVVIIAFVSFIGALALIPLHLVGEEFIPAQDPGQIFVRFNFPVGTPVSKTRTEIGEVEQQLLKIPDMQAMTRVAGAYSASFGGFVQQGNVGQIQMFLKSDRKKSTNYWVAQVRRIAMKTAPGGAPVVVPATGSTGGSSQPIDELVTDLSGGDPTQAAQKVATALAQTPGATNVNSSASALSPQVEVHFDRQAARNLDVSIGDAATAVRATFGGAVPTQVITPQGLMQVQVIYPVADQTKLGEVGEIPIRALNGSIVHIGDVAKLTYAPTLPLITRENRLTVIHVNANIGPNTSLSNVQTAFQKKLIALHLPSNIRVAPSARGQQSFMAQTLADIGQSMVLSLLLVFLLMVALYNSYSSPLIIMFSVPVAAVGALGSLALFHQTLNLFSLIGTILLIGLVTKNGILLVDYANTLRARGYSKIDAIRESAATRFRPIMMTTIAMVAGMFPLAIAAEPGSQVRQSLGIVVIGGLTSSLLLTLLLVPIMYEWLAPARFPKPRRFGSDKVEATSQPPEALPVG